MRKLYGRKTSTVLMKEMLCRCVRMGLGPIPRYSVCLLSGMALAFSGRKSTKGP